MENFIIGIKIEDKIVTAKAIGIIRKYTNASMAVIKNNGSNFEYVIKCDTSDARGIQKIRKCHQELLSANIKSVIHETIDGIESNVSIEQLNNMVRTHIEILSEVNAECEEESRYI